MAQITAKDIQSMVRHWLETPVNGYLGADYGQDGKSLLQVAFTDTTRADAFLQKMIEDIPILQVLPPGSLNLFSVKTAPDKTEIMIEVAGTALPVAKLKGNK